MNEFINICKMTQFELKFYLTKYLETKYNNVTSSDGFLYAKGTFPVMLVAHMDTVHKAPVKKIIYTNKGDIISSPQGIGGDDRCGIAMIMEIIKTYNCSVLFTEDEEIGCVGATKFVQAYEKGTLDVAPVNYIIELDRKGSKDAVFYECDNIKFNTFIFNNDDNDWKLSWGTYSDIVEIAPALKTAAVNFSCGYYNAHTTSEYVVISEMEANIEKVKRLLARTTEEDCFKFIESKLNSFRGWSTGWYENEYDPYDDDFYEKLYYIAAEKNLKYIEEEVYAVSEEEAVGKFLIDHPTLCVNDIVDIIPEN